MSAEAVLMAASALAGIAGQYSTNMANMKNQLAINKNNIGMQLAYNADQVAVAQMNNQTQIDLANTAHQREVNDLRDAGLNPILSATGGNGAAMPSLGSVNGNAPVEQAYKADNPLRELGTSARELGKMLSAQYAAEIRYSEEVAKAQELQNKMSALEYSTLREQTAVDNTRLRAERDAYNVMRNRIFDDAGREIITIRPDGSVDLNDEYVDMLVKGIKADLHNRKWSDVQRWIGTASGAASSLGSAVNSGSNAARIIQRMVK